MIQRKFFKRLFIIYISFTLVYGFIISSFFVFQNKRSMDRQELDNRIESIDQYTTNTDQRIASFVKYVDTLYLDSELKQFLINSDDYYAMTKLYEKLRRDMSVFSDIGGRITLSLVEDDRYINNQEMMSKQTFMNEYSIDSAEEAVIFEFYKNGKNREYMVMEDEINSNLLLLTVNAHSTNEKILVIQSIDKDKFALLKEDEFLNIIVNEENGDGYRIEEDRLIYYKQSDVLPSMLYEFNLPYKKTNIISDQFLTGMFLYLGIVCIGSIFAMFIAKSTYKPISNIMEAFDEDNEDKKDEFAFLYKITNDIKNANIELKTTLSEQKIDIKTKILRELANGINYSEHQHIIENDESLRELKENPCMMIINIEEDMNYNEVYLSDARNKIHQNIYTIIERILILEGYFYEIIELNANQFGVITANLDKEILGQLMAKLLKGIEVEEQVNIVFVAGQQVDTLLELEKSYQSALKILEYRSNFDKRAIIFYGDMEVVNLQSVYFYPIDLERELISQTLQGHNKQIEQVFDRIYNINFKEHCIDRVEQRKLIMAMIGTLRRVYHKMSQNDDNNEELEVIKLFDDNCYNEDELYNRIKITFLNYSDIVQQRSQSKAMEYSTEMINYIECHYHEDISLEEVATHLNLSTGYFSTIFKKETGENFKSFLNKYRVQKSKEYLSEEPKMKIKDLSLKVGYFNVNSFIRMFKKYEGVSPGEYAKKMNKSE